MTATGRRRLRITVIGLVTVAAATAVTVAALGVKGGSTPARPQPARIATATVTRATLTDASVLNGIVGYGATAPVTSKATGTVTWLPEVGTVVSRGQLLLRADDQPVVLLYGALPMYRPLTVGTKGPDVEQFERNLRELGYTGFTVDTEFSPSTAVAVRLWQKKLKRTESDTVGVGDVIFAEGALRVTTRTVRIGAAAAADVLTASETRRVVTLEVPVTDQRIARKGASVTVTLPDRKEVKGQVGTVGAAAQTEKGTEGGNEGSGAGSRSKTIPVVVDIADQDALGSLDSAPVTVRFVVEERANVLAVPVRALMALAEGGFGLELRDGATTRIVAVKVGLFAGDLVEVSADGLAEGMTVGVAE